jgi:ribonuclease HII
VVIIIGTKNVIAHIKCVTANLKNINVIHAYMVLILGVEEAGRGPVIGPMVMVGVLFDKDDDQKLIDMGVKDSKLLTPKKREDLFEKIKAIAKNHVILVVSSKEIDDALNSPDTNLNWLEAEKSAEIINYIKPIPEEVILDCPSNNPKAYTAYIKKHLDVEVKLRAEHKADFNYPIVGAASILAKVTRDRCIEKIKKDIGVDFGSGYPADPVTNDFLKKNWNKYPEIFRKTWASYKNVAKTKLNKDLSDF